MMWNTSTPSRWNSTRRLSPSRGSATFRHVSGRGAELYSFTPEALRAMFVQNGPVKGHVVRFVWAMAPTDLISAGYDAPSWRGVLGGLEPGCGRIGS